MSMQHLCAIGYVSPFPVKTLESKGKPKAKANKITHCACGKGGQHYTDTAMETVFPGTPEKIYNLMFTSGFIKDFMREGQKLIGQLSRKYTLRHIVDHSLVSLQIFRYRTGCLFLTMLLCLLVTCLTSSP